MKLYGFLIIFFLSINVFSYGKKLNFDLIEERDNELFCFEDIFQKENPDIIFIGENHEDYTSEIFIRHNIELFLSQGFSKIFIEQIEAREQYLLNRLKSNPTPINKGLMFKYLENNWGYDVQKYFQIINDLLSSPFKVYGIDERKNLNHKFRSSNQELSLNEFLMVFRDKFMFDSSKNLFRNEKVLFFNGWAHSFSPSGYKGKTLFEYYKESYPHKKILNIKIDYYKEYSRERNQLAIKKNKYQLNCKSGFFVYKGDEHSDFSHYIFLDAEVLYPVYDRFGDFI